jgi:hypothetical protein
MRTGCSYMGHHNPRHMATDLKDMHRLGCDDVLLAAQENDFVHMTGKLTFLPPIARDLGLRPLAIFWGALNLFGGGRSSQFLLEHPECHQVNANGAWSPQGCYNNPACVARIKQMIDRVAELGFQGYFVDEPSPLNCYCPSCRELFGRWYGGDLRSSAGDRLQQFRQRCVLEYVRAIAAYLKQAHPAMESQCCVMPSDQALWAEMSAIPELDNLGTDIYWCNNDRDVEEMAPLVRELAGLCKAAGKKHHQWLQVWDVRRGNERRILEQGRILLREKPDALYLWAYAAQIGTSESCDDPRRAWANGRRILKMAKES